MTERPLSDKMRRVLLAILELEEGNARSSANAIGHQCGYQPTMAKSGRSGRGHSTRVMGVAVHVNTALIALQRRGLVRSGPDYSFVLTDAGAREAKAARRDGLGGVNIARREGKTTRREKDEALLAEIGRRRG